jgi:ATP-binding cassette subfamily B protein
MHAHADRRDAGTSVGHSSFRLYGRLLQQGRPYWKHVAGLLLLSLLATPIALLAPLPLKIAVDNVIGSKPLHGVAAAIVPSSLAPSSTALLFFTVGLLLAITFLRQLQSMGSSVLGAVAGERLVLGFRTRLFEHVQRLSLAYHDSRGTADATYRIQYDAESIENIVLYGITPFLTAAFMLGSMLFVIAEVDWQLGLVALAISPPLALVTEINRRRLRRGWREAKQLESSALNVIQEVLTSLRVVKAFGQETRERDRFVHRAGEGMRKRIQLAFIDGWSGLLMGMTTTLGTAVVLFIGVRHVQDHRLTLGSLLLIMGYLSQIYSPLTSITTSVTKLQNALASAERAFTVLDMEPEVPEKADARPLKRAAGALVFENVSFSYRQDVPVLLAVSLAVPPGARVGISGKTGAGKTTLVNLLIRFYDPTAGQILLDGVDLRDYKLTDLRRQFAIVLQDPVLFSTSIAENIAYGRPEASFEDIVAAAKAANVHNFITGLPEEYETKVGERGMMLSGGERQRISLARAFLKDAPMLILDEPTSSVDVATEGAIMDAMNRLMEGRTTFLIAHRLSTLESCDVRIEVADGQTTEHPAEPVGAAAGRAITVLGRLARVLEPGR